MANETETRALGAALAAPAFVTRGTGVAMHAANRHVERWAPEAGAGRVRSMRALGFVDRLVAPWMETAQRSASMRLFTQYAQSGATEREGNAVSWVFPRPWYQDELDWMAAARQSNAQAQIAQQAPTMLTTRGTYVAPAQRQAPSISAPMPAALYEYVAPSLSIATTSAGRPIQGIGYGGETERRAPTREAYSPLVSLAAVQAAELMSRTVAPLAAAHRGAGASTAMSPGLRSVLTSILARASLSEASPTRLSMSAPELVTPPAPRPEGRADAMASPRADVSSMASPSASLVSSSSSAAAQVAEQVAAQRARVVELQRVALLSAQREQAARLEAARAEVARTEAARGEAQRGEAARASSAAEAAWLAGSTEAAATARGREVARDAALSQARAQAQTAAEQAAAAQAAEVRGEAQRSEAELRQRAGAEAQRQVEAQRLTEAQRQAIAQRAGVEAAERARIEERIAQRMVQNQGAQRLHEQARAEAAAHARAVEQGRADAAPAPSTVAAPMPVEIAAAIAGLPPELQAMLESTVAQRPERALQAISQLSDTLRTAELLARSSASGAAFEPTRGPRMTMPAGLGGLVHAVDRAQAVSSRPPMLGGVPAIAPLPQLVESRVAESAAMVQAQQRAMQAAASTQVRAARMPALSWLSAPASQASMASAGSPAPTSALGAVSSSSAPAALGHVAWADRWLARFAGASSQSLETMTASMGVAPEQRMQALAAVAPGAVFVAPDFLRGDLAGERAQQAAVAAAFAASSGSSASASVPAYVPSARAASSVDAPAMRLINQAPAEPVLRFDDDAETPDDVFFAISAAATRGRRADAAAAAAASSPASIAAQPLSVTPGVATLAAAAGPERHTFADLVAHAAPSAPGAGLSAQLASSPFAPALRHVLPLPSAASFDVRALFGSGLGATFLAGVVGGASRELEIGAQMTPAWASWAPAPLAALAGASGAMGAVEGDTDDRIDRIVPSFDATYLSADAVMTPAQRAALAMQDRAFGADGASMTAAQAASSGATTADASATSADAVLAAAERASVPLTTLRTALLSWGLSISDNGTGAPVLTPTSFAATPLAPTSAPTAPLAQSAPVARMMVDSLSLPLIGETAIDPAATWAAPGMLAERAQSWSAAQERSASDLALDFVPPELVLAARVYGLGPAEAAQAARLAVAGPGQLGAMASAVDRTFVDAMSIVRESRAIDGDRRQRLLSDASDATQSFVAPTTAARAAQAERIARELAAEAGAASTAAATSSTGDAQAIATAFPTSDGVAAAVAPTSRAPLASTSAFGVERRVPRGAFLWPQATVAALGMNATGSDGQHTMSLAALELLAAQVVAEVGTYAALAEADAGARIAAGEARPDDVAGALGVAPGQAFGATLGAAFSSAATTATATGGVAGIAGALTGSAGAAMPMLSSSGSEPGEADVLGAASSLVPTARRARFDALYVALSQTPAGRSWSPAARAARALALVGRSDEATISARERATTAWDVLPVVYAGGEARDAAAESAEASASGAPGAIAARAVLSEAMASHVAPTWLRMAGGPTSASSFAGGARSARFAPDGREMIAPDFDGVHVGSGGTGLNGLSARAGEALGSYVTPVAAPSAPTSRHSDMSSAGAMLRAPTAAPEYVNTRSTGRYGGGEVEIPSWFEAAARKMLSERSDNADGISLAELTLVTSAPAAQIAASTRSAPSATPPAPSTGTAAAQSNNAPQIDVEKLANEVYQSILVMMDIARARNGDPYL